MADQFDPNNMMQNFEQQVKDKVDSAIEDVAGKVPGGDQFAQQAKDEASQSIDPAGQQAQQLLHYKLGGMSGIGEQLDGMLGGGQDAGGQGSGSHS